MTYKQLMALVRESGLSPEDFGDEIGISGMTLRRWRKMPSHEILPELYKDAAVRAVHKLVLNGKLSSESKNVREILTPDWLPFDTAAKGLGLSQPVLDHLKKDSDGAVEMLSQIGGDKNERDTVDSNTERINSFKKMGEDWSFRISKLLTIIRSKKLHLVEKMVAYGALIYLLNPFDFIPDHIPVFGLLDDLFFLSIALSFYLKRYPEFFRKEHES